MQAPHAEIPQIGIAEPYVDVDEAGKFLGLSSTHVRRLVEKGRIKGYDYGIGKRKFWRFRLSELGLRLSSETSSVPRNQESL